MREYRIWVKIRRRCGNPRDRLFAYYGGRGIFVSPPWQKFEQFLADMGEAPSSEHTVERIDNDGPYSADNCRWATRAEQAQNTRRTVYLTAHGQRLSLPEWSKRTGIGLGTLAYRIRLGWDAAAVVDTPVLHGGQNRPAHVYHWKNQFSEGEYVYQVRERRKGYPRTRIEFAGKEQTVAAWARDLGMPETTLRNRLRRGWSIERALSK